MGDHLMMRLQHLSLDSHNYLSSQYECTEHRDALKAMLWIFICFLKLYFLSGQDKNNHQHQI